MSKQKITKEEILAKAWRLFHRHGYYDTSLQLIATAVGLGKAGLLHHFGSKEQLMRQVIDFAQVYYAERVLSELEGEQPFADRLRRFLDHHVQLCQLDRRGCFFANTILETSADGLFNDRLGQFHAHWIGAVRAALLPHYPTAEAAERAYRLFADYEGSVVIYKLHGDAEHLHRFVNRSIAGLRLPIHLPVV
ncbi:TetR/AcrR family transcriptional regulator [Neolewinella sp.]|uniref:TetR/AcrR family transcriptional regulator n=1 Tax=Neolewinella sp. TaxID=2993543 RepID=UPI003B525C8D